MINDLFTTPTMVDMLKFITMKYAQYQKMIQRNILNVVYCLRVEKFERASENDTKIIYGPSMHYGAVKV